jgi:hypothetical protein
MFIAKSAIIYNKSVKKYVKFLQYLATSSETRPHFSHHCTLEKKRELPQEELRKFHTTALSFYETVVLFQEME